MNNIFHFSEKKAKKTAVKIQYSDRADKLNFAFSVALAAISQNAILLGIVANEIPWNSGNTRERARESQWEDERQ